MEPDMIEIAPTLIDQISKLKSSSKAKGKNKVAFHEIIVDMDEDRNKVVFVEGKVESNKKTKVGMGISFGSGSAAQLDSTKVESNKKGKKVAVEPDHSFTAGSNNVFDLDDYVPDDDYSALQSYFDSIDLPPGIEAPIPCFENLLQTKKKPPTNPLVTSHVQVEPIHPNKIGPSKYPHAQLDARQFNRADPLLSSPFLPSSKKNPSVRSGTPYFNLMAKSNLNNLAVKTMPISYTAIGRGFYFSNNSNTNVNNSNTNVGSGASSFSTYTQGLDTTTNEWHASVMNDLYSSGAMFSETGNGGIYSMDDMLVGQNAAVNSQSPISSSLVGSSSTIVELDNDDVLKRYESFKKFDTVVDFSDHVYSKQNLAINQAPKNWAKKILEEWRILEKDLPDTIFVRVYESRMDLLRAVIIGAEGTPYHDGLFFFDVCFPSNYPNSPPLVGYHSRGLDINPNLYSSGKVCLSLLNTWPGDHKEMWVPGTSTMLQVLVSIQGLILNTKPYFNEPGFAYSSGSLEGEKSSLHYNENTLISSLKTMVYTMNKPPKNFEDFVVWHFRNRVRNILLACKVYTEGVQVGCYVKGSVQNVYECNNSCSTMFKNDVASYVKTLIGAFNKIGAKEADEFISLSEKKSLSQCHDWVERKEVAFHEIIDIDVDEDRNDVVFIKGKVESFKKMKGISLEGSSRAPQLDLMKVESNKKGKEAAVEPGNSSKGFNSGSNNFSSLDDYVFDDDYKVLQSHFDNIDLPTGVEAAIPNLEDLFQTKKKTTTNPVVTSHAQSAASQSNFVDPLSMSPFMSSSKNFPAVPSESNYSNLKNLIAHPAQNLLSSFSGIGGVFSFCNNSNKQVGTSSFSQFSINPGYPLGVDTAVSEWDKTVMKNNLELNKAYLSADMLSTDDTLVGQGTAVNSPRVKSSSLVGSSSTVANLGNDDVLKKYESFKKFDTVVDFSDHLYAAQKSGMTQPPKIWAKKIQDEWRILEKDLPDTIFVRAYESRMDLLRAVIIGAEGTPYHDGLFVFDVCFPNNYPNVPPHVKYHSGGLRINPNLYNCGKVCLSLLNTWSGGQKERWLPGTSTMLQVLVSIQGLILNTNPYFNEPGYAHSAGSPFGDERSLQYNESTLILSLKTMVYTMKKRPKNFEDLVVGHFRNRVRDILMACKAYTEGVQVGCLVKGGVQDVDEGNKSCSAKFKKDVSSYIKTLITEFKKIGANVAEEFLHLIEKKSPVPPCTSAPVPVPAPAQTSVLRNGHGFYICL